MGNWIPSDPTLVAQILKISAAYTPRRRRGSSARMTWGVEANVIERFASASVPRDNVSFHRENCIFNFPGPPSEFVDTFRHFYGPTMNAFEAGEKDGRAEDLRNELNTLFESQTSASDNVTKITANFLRVMGRGELDASLSTAIARELHWHRAAWIRRFGVPSCFAHFVCYWRIAPVAATFAPRV